MTNLFFTARGFLSRALHKCSRPSDLIMFNLDANEPSTQLHRLRFCNVFVNKSRGAFYVFFRLVSLVLIMLFIFLPASLKLTIASCYHACRFRLKGFRANEVKKQRNVDLCAAVSCSSHPHSETLVARV